MRNLADNEMGQKSAAKPPDVRKAFGLPSVRHLALWAMPNLLGRSPEFIMDRNGSAERFRTSGGIAEFHSLLNESPPQQPFAHHDFLVAFRAINFIVQLAHFIG